MAYLEQIENDFKEPEDEFCEKIARKVLYVIFEVYLEIRDDSRSDRQFYLAYYLY